IRIPSAEEIPTASKRYTAQEMMADLVDHAGLGPRILQETAKAKGKQRCESTPSRSPSPVEWVINYDQFIDSHLRNQDIEEIMEDNNDYPKVQRGLAIYNNMNEVSRFVSERVREMTDTGDKWQRTLEKLDETKKHFQEVEANMLDLLAEHRLLRTELLEFSDHAAT